MQGITYISSAGLKVLVNRAADFAALRGELTVMRPSPVVRETLVLGGLGELIFPSGDRSTQPVAITDELQRRGQYTGTWRVPESSERRADFEVAPRVEQASLVCRIHGEPGRVARGEVAAADCTTLVCRESVIAVGIGAIGGDYVEVHDRMGELVAACGAVAYLPTTGAAVPDYLLPLGARSPTAMLADGLSCEGGFSHLARFHRKPGEESATLSEVAERILEMTGSEMAGAVMMVEVNGLVGAYRRHSPAALGSLLRFTVPEVREDISFTSERAHHGDTALIVGIIARGPTGPLSEHLRPLAPGSGIHAHCHAVAFSYSPVPQRTVDAPVTIEALYQQHTVKGILHLLTDDRAAAGAGESEFLRGLVWAGPISEVQIVPSNGMAAGVAP